jgi:DIRAS family GTP-binding Ras-like protein 2
MDDCSYSPIMIIYNQLFCLGRRVRSSDRQVITCNKNSICTLQITDTTGSHQFPAMQRLNISKGHAFIMVYSITSRQSLEELKPTWEIIREIKVCSFLPSFSLYSILFYSIK